MVVTVTYSNGESEVVTNYTYSPNVLTAEDTKVTISYGGKTADVSVNVVNIDLRVVGATDTDGDLFGKVASDLQDNISVGTNAITGTLNYIADYSDAFSGEESYGNYLALKCTAESGTTIKVEVVGGLHGEVTLDPDGLIVCRIANNTQSIKVTGTKNGVSQVKVFTLTNLTLTPNA